LTPQCVGITRDGNRCRVLAASGSEWCAFHDPTRKEQRRRAAAKGGRSKGSGRISELHDRLETIAERVMKGELETGRGAVAVQAIGAQIRLLDYERKASDLDELFDRLEPLESARRYG
jgi:hypothetical protein